MKTMQKVEAYIQRTDVPHRKINQGRDAWATFMEHWNARSLYTKEEFYMLHLTRQNEAIAVTHVSTGGQTATIADGKNIFRAALMSGATAIILGHNHPSGTEKPSEADIRLTKQLKEFGELIGIKVLDHIIVAGHDKFTSLCDLGHI